MSAAAPAPNSTMPAAPAAAPAAQAPVLVAPGAPAAAPASPAPGSAPAPGTAPAAPPTPGAQPAAEAYQAFKVPDGFQLAEADSASVTALGREFKLDQAGAQKMVDAAATYGQRLVADVEAKRQQATADQDAAWATEISADPTLGGAAMPKTLELVGRARAAFDPKGEVGELLAAHGLANNPVLVRWTRSIGEALREDSPPPGGGGPGAAVKDVAEILYPNDRPRS